MRDTSNDIWNDNDGEEDEAPRRGSRLRRFGIFFLILAAVLAVVIVAAYRDGTGFDALQRLYKAPDPGKERPGDLVHCGADDSARPVHRRRPGRGL